MQRQREGVLQAKVQRQRQGVLRPLLFVLLEFLELRLENGNRLESEGLISTLLPLMQSVREDVTP